MLESYRILEVEPEPAFDPEAIESLGGKVKFWFQFSDDWMGTDWLFKYPRPDTGEHWAEKIAAEVAGLLGISCARVELAVCQGRRGSVTESFTIAGKGLVHGNELLEILLGDYDPEKRFNQSRHTLENILETLAALADHGPDCLSRFAEYLLLDAIIGNTDRHHENWGWLMDLTAADGPGELAPSFDHASSLGRELDGVRRERILTENRVGTYAERGRGGIYWSEEDSRSPSPLELLRRAVVAYPQFFRPGLAKLSTLDEGNILEIVNRIPADWMTRPQRDFAVGLMRYTLEQLRRLA